MAELLVAPVDFGGILGLEPAKSFEEFAGVEGLEDEVGLRAACEAGRGDEDDRNAGLKLFDLGDDVCAIDVFEAAVEDDSVGCRKPFQGLDGLVSAVRGENVELGGFNDEFSGGDAAWELPVANNEAGSDHADIRPLTRR